LPDFNKKGFDFSKHIIANCSGSNPLFPRLKTSEIFECKKEAEGGPKLVRMYLSLGFVTF
jgi:hypothetical protein